jgi:hypothetical protein
MRRRGNRQKACVYLFAAEMDAETREMSDASVLIEMVYWPRCKSVFPQ